MSPPSVASPSRLTDEQQRLLRERLARARSDDAIPRRQRTGPAPLAAAQERFWFLERLTPDRAFYNLTRAFHLRGPLDAGVLAAALAAVVRRHEPLRTAFGERDGEPVQVIAGEVYVPLVRVDLAALPAAVRAAEAARLAAAAARLRFDLARAPLLAARLVRLAAAEHLLLVTVHHLVFDGWSLAVFVEELGDHARAFAAGRAAAPPPLPVRYADFAVWERRWLAGPAPRADLEYWIAQLGGEPPALDLPADRPRRPDAGVAGAGLPIRLPGRLAASLRNLARIEGTTLFAVLLAGWGALLARYGGQERVLVGIPVANRHHPDVERLIGCFVNTLAMAVDLGGRPSGRRLLARVRDTVLDGLAHERLPFARLIEALAPSRRLDRMPLFESELLFQNTPAVPLVLPGGVEAEAETVDKGIAEVELSLELVPAPAGLVGEILYRTARFDRPTVERIGRQLEALLHGLAEDPGRAVVELPLLGAGERRQLEAEWSAPALEVAAGDLVHRRIAARAAQRPGAVAVAGPSGRLTYRQLDRRSNRLARRLAALGVGAETVVGVLLESSPALAVAMLAVLKAGGALLLLDPDHPAGRWDGQLADAGARLAVTAGEPASRLPPGLPLLRLDADAAAIAAEPASPPAVEVAPESAAYVVFTSGSTGRPKGVVVSHRALAAHLAEAVRRYGLGPGDRVLQFATVAFDPVFEQVLAPLAAGAAVVPRGAAAWGPADLDRAVAAERLSLVNLPPALWGQWIGERPPESPAPDWRRLRLLLVGGDAMPPPALAAWGRTGAPEVRLLNAYGPTEATVTATLWEVPWPPPAGLVRVPIGRPLRGRTVCVLDPRGEPQPVGVPGELCLGGAGLARGYLGRPRRTAERFVPDPFSRVPGARLYRTGDLGRYLPGGDLEFLGRVDRQVKLRGVRIEPAEVEAVLGELPEVRAAAVEVVDDPDRGGDRRLVAWVVPAEEGVAASRLQERLRAVLPRVMVPADFVFLAALPLTPSGKIDRRALPAPERREDGPERAFTPPETAAERVVAKIWSELLDVGRVAADDNFFDLGGHSLHATRVVHRLHELVGVTLEVRDLFAAQTVADLALRVEEVLLDEVAALDEEAARRLAAEPGGGPALTAGARRDGEAPLSERAAPRVAALGPDGRRLVVARLARAGDRAGYRRPIPRRATGGRAPLSWSQEILWYVENQPDNPPSIYRLAPVLVLAGALDVRALAAALAALAERHEILRTRFGAGPDGTSFQEVDPAARLAVRRVDLTALPAGRREGAARRAIGGEVQAPFDLGRAPLLRPTLYRFDPARHWLLLAAHHIVLDDWAAGVLLGELSALYNARRAGRPPELPALPVQYADYAVWERERLAGDHLERLRAFWHGRFADGLPQLRLATDRPRPPLPSYRGAIAGERLSPDLSAALRRRSREEGVSLFMCLLAAFKVLLSRRSGQLDVMVAVANANRPRREAELLIGSFFNLMLLRTDLGGDPTLRELLGRVRETALAAYAHQDFPFILVAPGYRPADLPAGKPPIQALFTFQNNPPAALVFDGLEVEVTRPAEDFATDLDVLLSIRDEAGELQVYLIYDADLFTAATAAGMLAEFRDCLAALAASPDRRLSEL